MIRSEDFFNDEVEKALAVLRKGGIILYPTDTIWGLGCDATNNEAVNKIGRIKKREGDKSLIILMADERQVLKYVAAPDLAVFDFIERQTRPTTIIFEDGCFIGSRCIVVEGVRVEKEAVLGANVVLTQSTKIIDVSGQSPIETKGLIPSRSVVIPGGYTKRFPAGEYNVSCALIIGKRKASTDLKTSLNDALRDFNVAV